MARIRTVKPDFWEDEGVALLSRDARLLFIACFNMADDEGLLRWSPPYVKAFAFMYDDDVTVDRCQELMDELAEGGMIFPYKGGKAQQRLAWITNFHKHQRVNRPQPSKLPAPSLQNRNVLDQYAERDDWTCHLCGEAVERRGPGYNPHRLRSPDHLKPRSEGGNDYPSNIRTACISCNKARGNRSLNVPDEELDDGVNDSVNESVNDSVPEGKGKERKGKDLNPLSTGVDPDDGFQHFWDAWPKRNGKKLGKERARNAWKKLTLPERRAAYIGAKHYAAASNGGMAGAKDAFRWLQGREWPDWQTPARPDSPGRPAGRPTELVL